MATRPTALTITPGEGGRLVTVRSLESVGVANYSAKVNFRRVERDSEGRREGWKLFRPNTGLPQGVQALPTGDRITLIAECVRPNQDRAVFCASKTTIYKYDFTTGTWSSAATGLSAAGKRWQAEMLNGYLVLNNTVDLPYTVRAEEAAAQPIHELRENGIAAVGHIIEVNGILQCYDITEIKAAELNGVMNGASPYGVVAANLCNRIAFRCIWGEIGEPRKWATSFTVTMAAASATITLPYASTVFPAGTKVAVINGGPNGGVLGGQTGYEDGIPVNSVAGAAVTLAVSTDASLTYPRQVTIMRWSDQSTIAGRYDLQDDATEVRAVKKLAHRVQIYRESSIFRCTYTGVVGQIFDFRRVLGTTNIPTWSAAIAEINGEYHLYPALSDDEEKGNRFYLYDGTNEPSIHEVCDDARDIFFDGVTSDTDAFAVVNPKTKEAWFCRPGKVFAFDYEFGSVSEIDAEIHAAAYIRRPGSSERWFALAMEGTLYSYGGTYLRNGVNPGGRITSGLISWGDRYNEKDLIEYVVHLGSGTAAPDLRIKLLTTHDERVAPAAVLNEVITDGVFVIPCLYRAMFFQDEISSEEAGDIDIRITARTFDRMGVNSKSTPKTEA